MAPEFPVVAAIQSASIKGDIATNLTRHLVLARQAAALGARLALFPELSLTGYEPEVAAAVAMRGGDVRLAPLAELAQGSGMTIVAGAPLRIDDALYIGAISFLPDGRVAEYTKQHLHEGEGAVFTAGPGGAALDIDSAQVALAVCADFTHSSHAQAAAQAGAALYAASVLVSPGGYAKDSEILRGYAEQYAMPVLMSNHGGPTGGWQSAGRSALWDERGRLVVESGPGECLVLASRTAGGWQGRVVAAA
ncbi:carbon-nitrogen hydrolase family protein [Pseudoduganella eburnea]|uniref:Carbon-nitrogen hydrolase family protein n=1 Tax=Massilia eburnea TaxID=1776165 RepID=A0A6L6QEI2_9BURK|nr:carbon-nitrogen hydrolase family protein [Massilia eburnea]MTW10782.1 carbon-nitrogen hydrolase family protein [Massilia eburnea]